MHTPTEHAKLSPSSAKRWLRCTGSVDLAADLPDRAGRAAEQGTIAHEVFASLVMEDIAPLRALKDAEMREAVRKAYVKAVSMEPIFAVEHRVDITDDCWGTADLIHWDARRRVLRITDLKYGLMSVEAEGNMQLQIYALGAVKLFKSLGFNPKTILGTILQPRLDPMVREAEYPLAELHRMDIRVVQAASTIDSGRAMLEAGDHCRFCPALAICPAYRDHHQRAAALAFGTVSQANPEDVDDIESVAKRLAALQEQAVWMKRAKALIKETLQDGKEVPGYHLDGRGYLARDQRRQQ